MNFKERIDNEFYKKNRRVFLKKIINFVFCFISVAFILFGFINLMPVKVKRKDYRFFEIPHESIPKEGAKKIEIKLEGVENSIKIFIVKNNNSLIALSPVCTHLGCFVNFDRNLNEFICPCHGGRYDIEGKVISGPPKESLYRLPIKVENGKILVGIKI